MAFNNRGNIYRDQGDYDRALADYDRALALDPAKPDPLASRGWVLSQKGEDERARQDFEKALALDPAPELKQKLEAALIAGDKDFQACDDEQGETAIAACGRAIASGRYSGEVLASLHIDIFPIRIDEVEPSPSLALFIAGTHWIDAFGGRLGAEADRLASLLSGQPKPAPAPLPHSAECAAALGAPRCGSDGSRRRSDRADL